MANEQLETAAKAFCEATDIRELYRLTESREKPYELLEVFAQSLIDKSQLFTLDHVSDLRTDIIVLGQQIEDLIQDHQLRDQTLSSAGKEVTNEDIQRYITAAHPDTIGNKPLQILMAEKIRISMEWVRNQFKSSPTSTVKVVSDNDVFMQAVKLYPMGPDGNPDDRETWIKGFKACREQLNENGRINMDG
jgi:hypothetical protein